MTQTGFAKRRDKNEAEIVLALEAVGATITRLNEKGVPDLLVGFRGRTVLLEVKGSAPSGHKPLTPDQQTWWNTWSGDRPQIVTTAEDALHALDIKTSTETAAKAGIWVRCPTGACDARRVDCPDAHLHELGTYPRRTK